MLGLLSIEDLADSSHDVLMDLAVGGNDTDILFESAPDGEVKSLALDVCHTTSGLVNQKPTAGVILNECVGGRGGKVSERFLSLKGRREISHPDLLLVTLDGGEPEIDRSITTSDRG